VTATIAANAGTIVSALVVAVVVFREFRQRIVVAKTLWIRPASLALLTLALAAISLRLAPNGLPELETFLAAGVAIGAVVGLLLVRSTHIDGALSSDRLTVRATRATLAIWVVVLLARFAIRFSYGASPLVGLDLNAASVATVAAAFAVIAIVFRNALRLADKLPPRVAGDAGP